MSNDIVGSRIMTEDFVGLFLGKKIGSGMARQVYEHGHDPSLVIKVEADSQSFQNVIEWKVWEEVQQVKGISRWFAPCVDISPCGSILIMKKVERIPKSQYPKKVPACFVDLKYDNFGMFNGHFVVMDYGTTIWSAGISTRMRKADWWER